MENINKLAEMANEHKGDYAYISCGSVQRRAYLFKILNILPHKSANHTQMKTRLHNGSSITIVNAQHTKALMGMRYNAVMIDEVVSRRTHQELSRVSNTILMD